MDDFTKKRVIFLLIAVLFLPCLVSGASSESFSNALYAGQNKMYTVEIPCTATVILDGSQGSEISLYAKKADSSWIPSAGFVMQYPDISSIKAGSFQTLFLDSGVWYVVAEAEKGFGEYTISIEKSCPITTGCAGAPCSNQGDCTIPAIHKEDVQTGFLRTGESKTYTYLIPGNRSYVEWILNGACDVEVPFFKSKTEMNMFTTKNCGPDFDLYVYKACNPKYYPCAAIGADTGLGSNAYIGIAHPDSNVLYYVKIFGKRGSGEYQLTTRSYSENEITIAGIETREYSGLVAPNQNLTAPDDLEVPIQFPQRLILTGQ